MRFRVVAGFSSDKDNRSCLDALLAVCPADRVSFVQAPHKRGVPVEDLQASLRLAVAARAAAGAGAGVGAAGAAGGAGGAEPPGGSDAGGGDSGGDSGSRQPDDGRRSRAERLLHEAPALRLHYAPRAYADRAERIAFNALPATWASPKGGDMWSHQ